MATEKYIGQKCISCKEVLKKDDDIVICPDCGSPYHRECYKSEGKCINTLLHEKGEEWEPEVTHRVHTPVSPIVGEIATAPITDVNTPEGDMANAESGVASYQEEYTNRYCQTCGSEVKADDTYCSKCGTRIGESTNQRRVCPTCQLENNSDNVFCARCGTPLDMEKATSAQGGFFGSPFAGFQRIKPDSDIDGNTVEEYSNYIGGKFFSFIPKFLKFAKQGGKTSFNLWAFIFPHFYFFFRKMNGIGIAALITTILLSVPTVFEYLASVGIISSSLIDSDAFLMVAMLFYVLSMIFKFACGLFADWLYYSKAKKDITKIKHATSEAELRKQTIISKGGTSWVGVLIASTVMVIVNIAIMMLITALNVI